MDMIKILQRTSNWKYILPLFILFCGVSFFIFPKYQSQLAEMAGEEVKPLDIRFSYTVDEVINDFEKLGVEGRDLYKFIVGRIDMVYPIIYGLFFILVLAYLLKKVTNPDSKFILIALLPLLGMLFDYLENFNTLSLLNNYPNLSEQGVAWGEQMTRIKHGLLFFSIGCALVLAIVLLIKKFMNRKNNTVYHQG